MWSPGSEFACCSRRKPLALRRSWAASSSLFFGGGGRGQQFTTAGDRCGRAERNIRTKKGERGEESVAATTVLGKRTMHLPRAHTCELKRSPSTHCIGLFLDYLVLFTFS